MLIIPMVLHNAVTYPASHDRPSVLAHTHTHTHTTGHSSTRATTAVLLTTQLGSPGHKNWVDYNAPLHFLG